MDHGVKFSVMGFLEEKSRTLKNPIGSVYSPQIMIFLILKTDVADIWYLKLNCKLVNQFYFTPLSAPSLLNLVQKSFWNNNLATFIIHNLKYLRSTTLGSKDIVIRKSEFVAKTQFLYKSLEVWKQFMMYKYTNFPGFASTLSVKRV